MSLEPQIIRERYKIINEIARGGMGIVYLAKDLLTNNNVALKTSTWASEQKTREAFETEAKLLARLNHPGLPKVLDYFLLDNNFQALVMDFIEGKTFAEISDSGKYRVGAGLDSNIIIGWSLQILDILSYLHGFSPPVIHRDIKPNNLKLKPDGTVVLLDFGLAKGTMLSSISGGSGYSSLEQLNLAATDQRSDIYAFAATLYQLLTNSSPLNALNRFQAVCGNKLAFSAESSDKTAFYPDPLKPISEINPHVPPKVSEIVMKALSLFPEDRFQNAEEMKISLLSAKNKLVNTNIEYQFDDASLNAKTQALVKGLLEEDEENLAVWNSKKKDDSQIEKIFPLAGSEQGEIAKTQLSFQSNRNENSDNRNFQEVPGADFTTFEIPHRLTERPVPKIDKSLVLLIIGAASLLVMSVLGFVVWQFLVPKSSKAENSASSKNIQSPIMPANEAVKKPIEVTTYLVENDGQETSLDEGYLFDNDEQFRFGLKPENEGYLYVISRNNQDKAQLAYPKPDQVDNSIKNNNESYFPPDNGKFAFNKDSPSEMWAYFVVVASRENEMAKRIRTILGNNKEKNLSLPEVEELMKDLDKIAEDSAKKQENKADSTDKLSIVITKLHKKN